MIANLPWKNNANDHHNGFTWAIHLESEYTAMRIRP